MEDLETSAPVILKPASLMSIFVKSSLSVMICALILWCIIYREGVAGALLMTVFNWLHDNGLSSIQAFYAIFTSVPMLPEWLAGSFTVAYVWFITVLTAMENHGMSGRPLFVRMEWISLRVGLVATLALVLCIPLSPSPFVVSVVTLIVAIVAIVDWSHASSSAKFHI